MFFGVSLGISFQDIGTIREKYPKALLSFYSDIKIHNFRLLVIET